MEQKKILDQYHYIHSKVQEISTSKSFNQKLQRRISVCALDLKVSVGGGGGGDWCSIKF